MKELTEGRLLYLTIELVTYIQESVPNKRARLGILERVREILEVMKRDADR